MTNFLRNFFSRRWLVAALVLVLLVVGVLVFWPRGNNQGEQVTVARGDVVQKVDVSGKVEPTHKVDLAFEDGGAVRQIYKKEGDQVRAGEIIAVLDFGTLAGERAAAAADVAIKRAEMANTGTSLEKVTSQYDTLVENARRTLLSEGLEAVPQEEDSTLTPPTLSGLYTGTEGEYRFRINRKRVTDQDLYLYNFDFDKVPEIEIDEKRGTPLGSKGLLVRFPDGVDAYEDTGWYVRIPNPEAPSYTVNFTAYQKALRDRQVAIENAQAALSRGTGSSVAEAELARAEAVLSQIDARLAKRQIRAPFAGVVAKVDLELGENVVAGTPVISVISDSQYEIKANIPEAEIAKIAIGNPATVRLDAYPEESVFSARVSAIDPAETIIDGVATYRMTLELLNVDDKVRSGMTTDIEIVGGAKQGVLLIPERALNRRDGEYYVKVLSGDQLTDRPVAIGLRGSDGNVEIVSGLAEGELVIAGLE